MISNECISRIKDLSTYWEKEPMSYYLKQKNYLLLNIMVFGKVWIH